ncbi:MAG: putative transport system permease protein [Acidobacteriaceae bacterium]|nr:putative transport system permease protein [Acidobacteriaceae bacterium]
MISELLTRLRFLILRTRRRELEEELEFHLEQAIASKISAGVDLTEARRQALIEFGGVEVAREQCERQRPAWWFGTVLQDVHYALRGFRRNPLFTISVLVTLALGIGATTAVFSVVDRILFRPLPYADPGRIVSVGMVHSLEHQEFLMGRSYVEWQNNQTPFLSLAAQSTMVHNCDLVENNPAQLGCISFQVGFLPLLGISPILGRNFLPEEDRPNGPRVVMISYGLWKGHYNGDPHILDRMIDVDGNPARVVGVLPKDFQFPTLESADIVSPFAFNPAIQQTVNGGFGDPMRLFARLRPGVSVAQAYAQMQPLFNGDLKWFPAGAKNELRLSIRSLRDRETQDVRPVAWVLFGFVLAVLLIACANVAGLMMARGAGRQRELAVRSAIGASRGRLIRQALTESLLLSSAGCLAGLALAQALVMAFVRIAPTGIPFIGKAHLDLRIAVFAALLSYLCGAIFGLTVALQKPGLATLNAKVSMSRSHAFLRRSLVTAQIAVSIVLLSGAVLLLRSFAKIEEQNLGMQTGGVLTVKVALPWWRYNTDQKVMDFYLHLESSVRRLPGTRAVGMADSIPPGGSLGIRYSDLVVEGKPPAPLGTGGTVVGRSVTPDYFRALNIPIVRGREFTEQDRTGNQHDVILSRLLAARMFPGEDPIGKRFRAAGLRGDASLIVVGMADNVKNNGLTQQSDPEMYTLRRSVTDDWGNRPIVLIDSVMPVSTMEPWVRSEVASIDRTVPVEMESLNQTISRLADRPRFETTLLGFFALTGLMLAVVGLYGLIAFTTTQRTHEIGVRMALGATRANILRLIANDGLRMLVVGLAIGLGTALAVSRMLKALLFQVSANDPLTYIVAPLLLSLVALIAILIPARAGTRVEPAVTLRAE